MKEYLVDANVLLRYLLNDVPDQAQTAQTYFTEAKSEKIHLFLPLLVFVEIDFALTKFYHFKRQDVIKRLLVLVKTSYWTVEKRDIVLRALLLYRDNKVSFVDALFVIESLQNNKTLLSFDKTLVRLAKKHAKDTS